MHEFATSALHCPCNKIERYPREKAQAPAVVVVVAIVAFSLLANIDDVHDMQIPMLWIATQVFSGSGLIFSVILFAGSLNPVFSA